MHTIFTAFFSHVFQYFLILFIIHQNISSYCLSNTDKTIYQPTVNYIPPIKYKRKYCIIKLNLDSKKSVISCVLGASIGIWIRKEKRNHILSCDSSIFFPSSPKKRKRMEAE